MAVRYGHNLVVSRASCLLYTSRCVSETASTPHSLIVGVAARLDRADDEVALAKILFGIGVLNIIDSMSPTGDLPDEIPAFVPHGACPHDPSRLSHIEGTMVEVELPSKRTRRLERK